MLESCKKLKIFGLLRVKWGKTAGRGKKKNRLSGRSKAFGINGFDLRRQEMVGDGNVALDHFGKLLGFAFPSHVRILTFHSSTSNGKNNTSKI